MKVAPPILQYVLAAAHSIATTPRAPRCTPEFLKEGSAVGDFPKPDWIIVGATPRSSKGDDDEPFNHGREHTTYMDVRSAELIKCLANAMLSHIIKGDISPNGRTPISSSPPRHRP